MSYVILGLDPAEYCGWAVLDEVGVRLESGVWDMSSRRHEGGGMRFVRFERHLLELLDWVVSTGGTPLVAYEEVARHKGTTAAHLYGGYISHITRLCEQRVVPYTGIPVGQVKKVASGVGNCGKEVMVEQATLRWSHTPADDNEADALWVAEALLVSLNFKSSWRE